MSCLKQWKVGTKVLGLMDNRVVLIADPGDKDFVWGHDQFTLATGLPGLIGVRDTINEVIEEIQAR